MKTWRHILNGKNMRKKTLWYLGRCIAFLLGLALLLQGMSYLYRPRNNRESAGMEEERAHAYLGETPGSIDVFFVGSSEFYSDVSPMKMWEEQGITAYDMATSSQRLRQTYGYLHELFQTQNPRVVVVDGYVALKPCDMNKSLFSEGVVHFPVLERHENWKRFDWKTISSPVRYTYREITKGYRPSGYTVKISYDDFMTPTDDKVELELLNRIYLERIRLLCKAHGAQMVLLAMPSPKNWDYPHHNTLQAYAEEAGIPFLDLNLMVEQLNIEAESDYRDNGDHLNRFGAHKASAYLADYLAEHFSLEDHRQDDRFAVWQEDLQKYLTRLEEKYARSYEE
jgi:hypothetical protein